MPTQHEIERKWLVAIRNRPFTEPFTTYEDVKTLVPPPDRLLSISQNYLSGAAEGTVERLRATRENGETTWVHCIKEHVGPGHNLETETEIRSEEQLTLLLDRFDGLPVIKERLVWNIDGLAWELDLFQSPACEPMLEVELESLDQEVQIPSFLRVLHEVTGDSKYSNWALSREDWSAYTCPECDWKGLRSDMERKMWCDLCPECRVVLLGKDGVLGRRPKGWFA